MNVPVTPVLEHLPRFCRRVRLTKHMVKKLVREGRLEHIMLGNRIHIPIGAFERFVEKEAAPCRVETPAPISGGPSAPAATTSSGTRPAVTVSAALVRHRSKQLKSCCPNSAQPRRPPPPP